MDRSIFKSLEFFRTLTCFAFNEKWVYALRLVFKIFCQILTSIWFAQMNVVATTFNNCNHGLLPLISFATWLLQPIIEFVMPEQRPAKFCIRTLFFPRTSKVSLEYLTKSRTSASVVSPLLQNEIHLLLWIFLS